MGNLCGKAESSGQRLGSSPQGQATDKTISPSKAQRPGRPLGHNSSSSANLDSPASLSPREAAARAAEARENEAKAKAKKGSLAAKLETQKRMTSQQHHNSAAHMNDALVWD